MIFQNNENNPYKKINLDTCYTCGPLLVFSSVWELVSDLCGLPSLYNMDHCIICSFGKEVITVRDSNASSVTCALEGSLELRATCAATGDMQTSVCKSSSKSLSSLSLGPHFLSQMPVFRLFWTSVRNTIMPVLNRAKFYSYLTD